MRRETKVTYKQTALFSDGGMRKHWAADRSTLIFTPPTALPWPPPSFLETERINTHCLIVPPLLIGYFSRPVPFWIFPCPAIFSQVLIFSFCPGRSRQPPRYFQRSGLHANCLSMARLPPTYIMHLVSSARSGAANGWAHSNSAGRRTVKAMPRGYGSAKAATRKRRGRIKKNKKKNHSLPRFLAESFRGWAGRWDILKDELREIAVVSLLSYTFPRANGYETVHHLTRQRYHNRTRCLGD